jgi:hypothetical protein
MVQASMSSSSEKENILCLKLLFLACGRWLRGLSGLGWKDDFSFPAEIDWDVFGKMAYYHNLDALFYFLVTEKWLPGGAIPPQLIKEWEKAYFNNLILNSEILSLLRRLLEECRLKDIPVIVLKGPAAIAQVYCKNTGLRAMADLDLLCRQKDLKTLGDIAFSLGCRRQGFIRLHHLTIAHETLGIYLEFHFNLYHFIKNKKHFLKLVWEKKRRVKLEGFEFLVMPLEAQLTFEVGHFLEHGACVSLKHYLDFAAKLFLLKEELDGKELERLLNLTGLRHEFISFSAALPEWLGIPPERLFFLAAPPPVNMDALIRKRLKLSASIGFSNPKRVGAQLARQAGLIKKIIFIFKRLFPPLAAIQAAYDLSSRRKAFLWIPRHLQVTLRDFQERKSTEAMG